MLVGPLPTPGIAFITSSMRADAGVVICGVAQSRTRTTASSSSPRDGFKLPDEVEAEIERAGWPIGNGHRRAAPDGADDRQGRAASRTRAAATSCS